MTRCIARGKVVADDDDGGLCSVNLFDSDTEARLTLPVIAAAEAAIMD